MGPFGTLTDTVANFGRACLRQRLRDLNHLGRTNCDDCQEIDGLAVQR